MYKIYFIVSALSAVIFSCSHPIIVKQQTIGGSEEDALQAMCATKDGGFVAGAYTFSDISGEKTVSNHGVMYSDYWVMKFDRSYKMRWQKCFGGLQSDFLRCMAATSDGGCIVGGETDSDISGDKTEKSKGGTDIWIIKLDSAGNIQWDKTLGGAGSDVCEAVQQANDGSYIISGASNSNKSGDKSQNSFGDFDLWVIKLDKYGKIIWEKTIGGNRFEFCGSIELTKDNGIVICGNSASDKSKFKKENNGGSWLLKLDSNGNIMWEKTYAATDEMFLGICKTNDNGFALAAFSEFNKKGEKSENSKGAHDCWIIKTDSLGNKIWDKTIGGNDDDYPAIGGSIHQTMDGGYIIGGYSRSGKSGDKTDSCRGGYDYWIVKLNKTGNVEWDKTIGGDGNDELRNVIEIKKDHFILGGKTDSGQSADKTDSSRGGTDCWFVYLYK